MPESTVFQRNILALALHNSALAQRLSAYSPEEDNDASEISFIEAKTGEKIPVITNGDTSLPLHSRFNPVREGERFLELYPKSGFLVFFGLGAGFHIHPFLMSKHANVIVIIERSLKLFSILLEHIDLCHIFNDHRVKILVDASIDEIRDFFLLHYLPGLFGDLATVPLLPRLTAEQDYFKKVTVCVEDTINTIADDYTVQVKFGKLWFRNTLQNLMIAESAAEIVSPHRKVIITGAGPSLELSIDKIRKDRKGKYLIATDTSLPVLCENGIIPDCVISIDCQTISYHHFISGYPSEVPLVLDLASPPILSLLTERKIYFSSGHPFAQYINTHWRGFPKLDTSGGNVSHAAVSLAVKLGAEEIFLYGLDFSYPEGKTYSRGSYIYTYFYHLQNRKDTVETLFSEFIFRNKTLQKDRVNGKIRYTPKPLLSYKERFEKSFSNSEVKIFHESGYGHSLSLGTFEKGKTAKQNINELFSAGASKGNAKQFIIDYRNQIKNLPKPQNPVINYLYGLSRQERELWMTQFPVIAALRDYKSGKDQDAAMLLEKTRKWTLSIIDSIL